MAAQIFLISVWANSMASTTVSSFTSFAPDSIITMRVGGADHHDVQQAVAHLGVGGIDDEAAVHQSDAHRADRAEERNIGKGQRGGGCR